MSIGADNAIGFLQVRLRGGWKNFASTSAVYGSAVVALMVLSTHLSDAPASMILRSWLPLLLGIQGLLLFLLAGTRVTAAIRHDLNSRMIESHRLMPTSAGQAVTGYLVGSTSQAMVLAGVTLVIGVFAASAASVPVADWLLANAVLAGFCASIWAVLGYLSFVFRTPFLWVLAVPVLSLFTEGMLWTILPPLTLFSSPLIGRSVFAFGSVAGPDAWTYMTVLLLQASVAGICFIAASRRYVRDDAIGLGPVLGLGLLALAAAAAWIGIVYWGEFRPAWFRNSRRQNDSAQLIASLLLMMLLALIPVVAATRIRHIRLQDAARPDPDKPVHHGMRVILVVIVASAIIAAVPSAILHVSPEWRRSSNAIHRIDDMRWPWAATAALVLMTLTSFSYVIGIALRLGRSAGITGAVWLGLTWIGPIIADATRDAVSDRPTSFERGTMGLLSTCSPVGALIAFWQNATSKTMVTAVLVQAALAVVIGMIYHGTPLKNASRLPRPARNPER